MFRATSVRGNLGRRVHEQHRSAATMSNPPVTLKEIQEAKARIVNVAYRTPLYLSPRLSALTNAKVHLKLESYQPIRVFKIRGAANKILKLTPRSANAA